MRNLKLRLPATLVAFAVFTLQGAYAQVVLTVDRDSGQAGLRNDGVATVNVDGYSIMSTNGLLSEPGWFSFTNAGAVGWGEATNSNANGLAEFTSSVSGAVAIGAGQTASIGAAYKTDVSAAMTAVGFGNAYEDVLFSYADDDLNDLVISTVEYTGTERFNNLVLDIDVDTGLGTLTNESSLPVTIDFYQITSGDPVLDTDFDGLTQSGSPVSGWQTGNLVEKGLVQFYPQPASGYTVPAGATFQLGPVFEIGNDSRDVDLRFRIVGGDDSGFLGVVRFTGGNLLGDFNGDGRVDLADYTVWRDNLGAADSVFPLGTTNDGSGFVDAGDYTTWKANFGAGTGQLASLQATQMVPEPAAGALLLAFVVGCVARPLRRR